MSGAETSKVVWLVVDKYLIQFHSLLSICCLHVNWVRLLLKWINIQAGFMFPKLLCYFLFMCELLRHLILVSAVQPHKFSPKSLIWSLKRKCKSLVSRSNEVEYQKYHLSDDVLGYDYGPIFACSMTRGDKLRDEEDISVGTCSDGSYDNNRWLWHHQNTIVFELQHGLVGSCTSGWLVS